MRWPIDTARLRSPAVGISLMDILCHLYLQKKIGWLGLEHVKLNGERPMLGLAYVCTPVGDVSDRHFLHVSPQVAAV